MVNGPYINDLAGIELLWPEVQEFYGKGYLMINYPISPMLNMGE